jgi:branched-chain amino acid transport system ATP-binding protein
MSAAGDVILRTEGVGKTFGKFVALKDISAEFRRGAITSIIGPNGAGKSTYFNLLSGAFPPSTGRVEFEGRDVTGLAQHRFAHMGVAKSFQITNVFPQLSTHENIRVAAQAQVAAYDIWRPRARLTDLTQEADAILERVGLWERRDRVAGTLAHGEQRALEIGMALASRPRLLLLDEPTAGMSPEETLLTGEMVQRLNADGVTVLAIEHDMSFVRQVAQRVTVLHLGKVFAQGSIDQIVADERVAAIYLGQACA